MTYKVTLTRGGLPLAEHWVGWQSRFSEHDARAVVRAFHVAPPMDSVLGQPTVFGEGMDYLMVGVPILAAPGQPSARIPIWQVWDLADLRHVVRGLVAFAAMHESMELLRTADGPAWDPHGPAGDVVSFGQVMRRSGARFWATLGEGA